MDDEKETALMWETLAKKAMDVAPVSEREGRKEGGREGERERERAKFILVGFVKELFSP